MSKFHAWLLAGAAAIACASAAALAQPAGTASGIPDFSSGDRAWNRVGIPFLDPQTNKVIFEDPANPFKTRGLNAQGQDDNGRPNPPDWKNPNFKPWVAEKMKAFADEAMKGKIRVTNEASCWPGGTPGQMIFNEPLFILQTPTKVTLLYQRDHAVRHVYMNVPHSKNPKPSWYGESVGHYEGDELVVDTVGLNDKTFVDNYRTPHTTQLHVVERLKLVDGGKTLQVGIEVEDPGAFTMKWRAVQRFKRWTEGPMAPSACAENNFDYFTYKVEPIPQAAKPDF